MKRLILVAVAGLMLVGCGKAPEQVAATSALSAESTTRTPTQSVICTMDIIGGSTCGPSGCVQVMSNAEIQYQIDSYADGTFEVSCKLISGVASNIVCPSDQLLHMTATDSNGTSVTMNIPATGEGCHTVKFQ